MRCLLLLLTLFWVVHSVKFRQFSATFDKCMKEYFCLVSPDYAFQQENINLLVPMHQVHPSKKAEIGILIQPLSPLKWIFVMRAEDVLPEEGLFLSSIKKELSTTKAHTAKKDEKIVNVIGCVSNGVHESISTRSPLTYEVRPIESEFQKQKKLSCVVILTSQDGKPISEHLNDAQTNTHELRLLYFSYEGQMSARQIYKSSAEHEKVDFSAVNAFMRKCDYSALIPPTKHLLRTHYIREVETFSDTIDCKNNLMDKDTFDSEIQFDLLVKFKPSEEPTEETYRRILAFTVDKITCDAEDNGYGLFYHRDGVKTKINEEVIVACGERPRCALPPTVLVCANCSQFEKVEETCNAHKDKCAELKCPNNRWFINGKIKYNGTIECVKESVEDETIPKWYTNPIDGKRLDFVNGSCPNLYECNEENPIHWTCGDKKDCFRATFVSDGIYCPVNYDIKYMTKENGNEYEVERKTLEPEIQILCDRKTGKWKLKDGKETPILNVFCIFNRARDNKMIGGDALVSDWDSDDNIWRDIINYWYLTFLPLLIFLPFNIFFYKHFKRKRDERIKKRKLWVEKVMKKRKDRKQEDWTRWEKWVVRPFNYFTVPLRIMHGIRGNKLMPNGPGRYGRTQLGFNDLRKKTFRALNAGFIKDFSLYSNEEKYTLLTNVVHGFSTKERAILLTIPLLKKCLEYDDKDPTLSPNANLKQPMHPMLVREAFRILKLLVSVYSKREKEDEAERVRKVIGIRANNLLFDLGLERAVDEPELTTTMRNICLEAALFARQKDVEERLLKLWEERQFDISNPARKFVWAAAVKYDKAFNLVVKQFNAEVAKYHARWDRPAHPDDENWGDILEHLIYAMCAEQDRRLEYIVTYVLHNPIFTDKHMEAAFHSMLEIFDYNHLSARLMFRDHHDLILAKTPYDGPVYANIFQMMYTWCGYWKGYPKWITAFVAKHFSHEERVCLLTPLCFSYIECYQATHKFTKAIPIIEKELSWVDHVKKDERDDPPPLILNKRRMPINNKPRQLKKHRSHRSWRDVGFRKVPKKKEDEDSKASKASKGEPMAEATGIAGTGPGYDTKGEPMMEITGIAETGPGAGTIATIQKSKKSGAEKVSLKTGKDKGSMKTGREKVKSLVEKTAPTQEEKSGSVKAKPRSTKSKR